MSAENLARTLEAVETALAHLARQLEAAGFAAGAQAYQTMADVVVGQRIWASTHDVDGFEDQYARVSGLATRIYEYLAPYQDVMSRLAVVGTPAVGTQAESGESGDLGSLIVEALRSAGRGLSSTRLSALVGRPTSAVREELESLVAAGTIRSRTAGGRRLFEAT